MNNIPEICMDNEGYPTEEYLEFIKNYTYEVLPIEQMVDLICNNWQHGSWGYHIGRKYKGFRKFELHTGGWSGNEEIINAITSNIWLTEFNLKYYMWRTGGHYYFKIKVDE